MIKHGNSVIKVPYRRPTEAERKQAADYLAMYLDKYPAENQDPDNIYMLRTLLQYVMCGEEQWRKEYEEACKVMEDDFLDPRDPDRIIAEYVIRMYEACHPPE